jgi:hypothetical protein
MTRQHLGFVELPLHARRGEFEHATVTGPVLGMPWDLPRAELELRSIAEMPSALSLTT